MPTRAARRPRLADAIIDEIAVEILQGSIAPGSLLTPEPQLSERFGVSRTVVREAIKRLQSLGLIEVRHGIGTVVLGPERWDDFDPDLIRIRAASGLIADLADDLFAIRRIIEIPVAAEAVRHRTDAQVERLGEILHRMQDPEVDPATYTDLDIEFHNILFEATGNMLLVKLMRPISQMRRIGSLMTTSVHTSVVQESRADHEAIYQAMADGDAERAHEAMIAHLDAFERDLIEGLASTRRD